MTSICNSTLEAAASSASQETLGVPDDAQLLRSIGNGNQSAFRELVLRHSRYLYGIAFSLSGNAADAEDLVQETFVAVLNSKFRGESLVRTWLVQILVRRSAMLRRTRKRSAALGSPVPYEESAALATRASTVAGADARLDLAAILAVLSPEHRQVIVLREVEQMSYEEMAAALGVPRGTVESRLHRARVEIRQRFKDYLQER
jgi:RNA polymerase sigma-70 factor (ECF subfamily)